MASIVTDRLDGLNSATAIKGPCRVATTANITLSGLQTVDGVSLAADDRVLVKNQTSSVDNGIYIVSTGLWRRSKDFAGNRDVKKGTQVFVTSGTTYAETIWYVTSADPITIDTTAITFASSGTVVSVYPHIASVALLEALDTATNTVAYLSASGREGLFKRVTTVSYSSWITADTEQGVFVLSTVNASYAWMRADVSRLDIRWFGAVADATVAIDDTTDVYTPTGTGAVAGTDCLAAVQGAVALSTVMVMPVYVPAGLFRCAVPNTSQATLIEAGSKFHMFGEPGQSWLIIDDDATYTAVGQTGNTFIASAQLYDAANYDRGVNEYFILRGIGLRGTWWRDVELGGRDWTASLPYRVHAIGPTNTAHVLIENVSARDIMGMFSRARSNGKITFTGCDIRRIAGDGYRAEDCDNVLIHGNYGLHVDDNVVAVPDLDDMPNTTRPRRAGISVTWNEFESCCGMLVLGPAATDISHNIMRRCYLHNITAFAQTADVTDRGEGGFRTTTISHNIIEDPLKNSALADPPDGTWSTDIYGINIQGGAPTSPTGTGTGTPATLPYASATQTWGAMHAQDIVGSDAVAGFRGAGLQCVNNTIIRTHQSVATYSLLGFGERFTRWGFDNPAITDAEFAIGGIQLRGDFYGARVVGNIIQNFRLGAGIYLARATVNMAFRRVLIALNQIGNALYPIDCDATSTKYQDIAIVHNNLDADPYRIQSARAAGNKWTAGFTADAPCCIHLTYLHGLYVAFNHFRNAANPWSLEGGAVEAIQYNTLRGNVGYVGIETGTATNSVDVDNQGLGRIPRSGDMITYRIQDLDPASATFEQDQAGMLTYSAAIPASGHYVEGHEVKRTTGGYWQRLTTGTAHVDTVDWILVS